MFRPSKALITQFEVTTPDPPFVPFLPDRFGGATGEPRALHFRDTRGVTHSRMFKRPLDSPGRRAAPLFAMCRRTGG